MQQNAHSDSPMPAESFPTDPTGLPEATRPAAAGAGRRRRPSTCASPRSPSGSATPPCGCSATTARSPAPPSRSGRARRSIVHVTNDGDLDTTVHWHGLRLENKYDGVPHETQTPIPVGGSFTYRIQFPDPGLYWYHPHIREDYTQEMGLYGNILVEPAEPDYWPPANRDVVLTLDDVLLEDGKIAPFSPAETSYAAMGRFGNLLLIGGEPDLRADRASGRGAAAVADQHRQHPRLQRPAARRADEARRRRQRPGGARGVRLRGPAGAVGAGRGRRAGRPARAADPGAPHPEPDLPAGLDHRDRGARGAVAGRPSSSRCAGHRSWTPSGSSSTPGWPRRRTRSWRWSPRWTTPAARRAAGPIVYACPMHPDVTSDQPGRCPKCGMKLLPPPRRPPTPARCTRRSPATSRAAAPSAA